MSLIGRLCCLLGVRITLIDVLFLSAIIINLTILGRRVHIFPHWLPHLLEKLACAFWLPNWALLFGQGFWGHLISIGIWLKVFHILRLPISKPLGQKLKRKIRFAFIGGTRRICSLHFGNFCFFPVCVCAFYVIFWVDLHPKPPMQDKLEFSGFPRLTGFQFVCKNILPFLGEPYFWLHFSVFAFWQIVIITNSTLTPSKIMVGCKYFSAIKWFSQASRFSAFYNRLDVGAFKNAFAIASAAFKVASIVKYHAAAALARHALISIVNRHCAITKVIAGIPCDSIRLLLIYECGKCPAKLDRKSSLCQLINEKSF